MDILDEAIVFAVRAHSGQTRKGSDTPYIVHPMEAAAVAATMTGDREVIAAAVLHDTVEDTPVTIEKIRKQFGERIADLVAAESEDKREDRPATETWTVRKQETLDALIAATREEQIIVLADKLSNARAIYRDQSVLGDGVWERFNQRDKERQRWYYEGIADRLTDLKDSVAYREYADLIHKIFD